MTRARKQTVDYFPHQCNHGQTMFILEQQYGNDGYAFWFKLLELLGKTEGHYLDCNKPTTWNYLVAKTLVDKQKAEDILNLLAELEAIDAELWTENKIVWSDNFIKGLSFAYRNREVSIPDKPVIECKKSGICGVSDVRNPQSKGKERKGKEIKGKYIASPENGDASSFFVCQFFEVDKILHEKLTIEYPAMTDDLFLKEFSRMDDWLTDNPKPKRANGKLKNPRLFIKNWLDRVIIKPTFNQLSKADQVTYSNFAAAERVLEKWEKKEPN